MPDQPPSETPTEITKNEQAKWQGIISGFVSGLAVGLKANLQNLAIIGLACLAGCNYWNSHVLGDKEAKDAKHLEKATATKEDVADLQMAVYGMTVTNKPAETNEP